MTHAICGNFFNPCHYSGPNKKMIRELISKFNRTIKERRAAPRRRHTALVRVWFDPDVKSEHAAELARSSCVMGETIDISSCGIGFLVPSIRIKEKYLVGQQRILNIELDLPTGKVYLRALGCRYEKVGIHISTERFLVGVQIVEIVGTDKEIFEAFLQSQGNRRVKVAAAGLEFGVD